MFKSLQSKLIVISLAAIFVATALGFYLTVLEHRRLVADYVSETLEITTMNLADSMVEPIALGVSEIELTTLLLAFERQDEVLAARIIAVNGDVLAQFNNTEFAHYSRTRAHPSFALNASTLGTRIGTHRHDGRIEVVERIGDPSYTLGYLWVIKDIDTPLDNSVQTLFKRAFPLVLALLTVVVLVYIVFQKRLLKPLISLTGFTRNVKSTQDYSKRACTEGDDEVATLSSSLNELLQTIEQETRNNLDVTQSLLEHKNSLEQLASTDSLTGLANRQYFLAQLETSLKDKKASGEELVVMYFDLDGFKEVNDGFGHEFGDHLLQEVGNRVRHLVGGKDLLARLGGDEFTILLRDQHSTSQSEHIAQRVVEAMEQPLTIDGWEMTAGVSMGVVRATDANYESSTLLSYADIAMYRSKALGKGRYTLFDKLMLDDNTRKLTVASSLESGLENGEFALYYQPKVDHLGEMAGVEALIRWKSATLGWVSPAEFIPIAEKSGKIRKITHWVLNRACEDLVYLNTMTARPMKVSVNLSAIDITYEKMADSIRSVCQDHHISPTQFEFEVTESAYLKNFADAETFFSQVRKMGSTIALDDFGTGYSSLGYLTQISIDTLKIDKQFIDALERDPRSRIVTNTIITMAKGLGLKICAEGVENHNQQRYLLDQHVDTLQGYLFSKPLPLQSLAQLATDKSIKPLLRVSAA